MAVQVCECGAKYRVPDDAEGKRAQCKRCRRVMTIGQGPLAIEFDPTLPEDRTGTVDHAAIADPPPPETRAQRERRARRAQQLVAVGRESWEAAQTKSFLSDVGWSFAFFLDPQNVIMWVIIAGVHVLAMVVAFAPGIFGFMAQFIVFGWICSYWLKVIEESSAGEERLPVLSLSDGVMEDILEPAFRLISVGVLAGLPAITYSLLAGFDLVPYVRAWDHAFRLLAVVLIPMFMLVVTLAGVGALIRIDLIVRSIAKTLPGYLVVLLLFAAASSLYVFPGTIFGWLGGGTARGGALLILPPLIAMLQSYGCIVSSRLIGVYYRHNKNNFAWSWG